MKPFVAHLYAKCELQTCLPLMGEQQAEYGSLIVTGLVLNSGPPSARENLVNRDLIALT